MKEIHFSFVFVLAYSYLCAYIFDLKSRIIEKERQICTAFQKPCFPGVPMPKVENFCGGVQVTIDRTQFMKMMNGGSSVTSNVVSDVGSLSVVHIIPDPMCYSKIVSMACRMSFRRLGSLRCSLIYQDFIAVSTLTGKGHQTTNGYHVNLTSQQFLQILVDFTEGKETEML